MEVWFFFPLPPFPFFLDETHESQHFANPPSQWDEIYFWFSQRGGEMKIASFYLKIYFWGGNGGVLYISN